MYNEKASASMRHWCSGHVSNASTKSCFSLKADIWPLFAMMYTVSKPYMLWIQFLSVEKLYLWILWQLGPLPQILTGCIPKGFPNVIRNYPISIIIWNFTFGLYSKMEICTQTILDYLFRGTTAVQGALIWDHWNGSHLSVNASWFFRLYKFISGKEAQGLFFGFLPLDVLSLINYIPH